LILLEYKSLYETINCLHSIVKILTNTRLKTDSPRLFWSSCIHFSWWKRIIAHH